MDRKEQKEFVVQLLDAIKTTVVERIEFFPEEWDGYELRQYIADVANYYLYQMSRGRKMAYNNVLRTNPNLLI